MIENKYVSKQEKKNFLFTLHLETSLIFIFFKKKLKRKRKNLFKIWSI